jgi:hypothetical protein
VKKLLFILSILAVVNTQAQESYSQLNLKSDDFTEFAVFADSLEPYRVYFTGENHNYLTFNTELEWKLLRYLNQEQSVNHFLFEQSPAVGYLIESAVNKENDGNMSYLKNSFYKQFYYAFKQMRAYNDTLDDTQKIHIHGIDIERFPYFSIEALNCIIDTLDHTVDGGEVFEQIKALGTSDYAFGTVDDYYYEDNGTYTFGQVSAWSSLQSIIKLSDKYRTSLGAELGADSTIYYSILKSLEIGQEWYVTEKKGDVRSPIIRESFMKDEFEIVYTSDTVGKFYGQFGRCHLHKDAGAKKCYDHYMNSIANRIQEIDQSLDNKVLVIPVYYSTGLLKFDKEIIESLELSDTLLLPGTAHLIDLAYKDGNHAIDGFYSTLPFVIVSNVKDEPFEELGFEWNEEIFEIHGSAYYGYRYFNGIRRLNSALSAVGANDFTNKFIAYDFALDMYEIGGVGMRAHFTYIPEINNGDRFDLKGWRFGLGQYITAGNKWFTSAFGLDYTYGQMSLTELLDNSAPNLIQSNGQNLIIYQNDVFSLDPNIEFRLTLPVVSFNLKAGYELDVSGKRWRLDGKMNDFTKTSFSAPYIQAGISLNFKMIQ